MKTVPVFWIALAATVATSAVANGSPQVQTDADLDQGWSVFQQTEWYSATQGSRLLPESWFLALEQPGKTASFTSDAFISSFRYIPRKGTPLPVGFAVDVQDDEAFQTTRLRWKGAQGPQERWVGMNCAACHTGEITYKGHTLRVEGAPALADFQGFIEALDRSLGETYDQAEKFARFSVKVLGAQDSALNRDSLRAELGRLIAWQHKIETMNKTNVRYGYGRLDAFGHIFNKVALAVDASAPTPNPANAPVSYPFLWNVPQQDRVQWNGIAQNKLTPMGPGSQPFDYGALGRNAGEVIGVFADLKLVAHAGLSGFVSSVRVASLVSMEQLLGSLRSPRWPASFPAIKPVLAEQGRALYEKRCVRCHALVDRTDLKTPIKVQMSSLDGRAEDRTDPWMACNAYLYTSAAGVLAGTPRDYFRGDGLPATSPLADLLATTVEGVLVGKKVEALGSLKDSFFGRQPPPVVVSPPETGYREETTAARGEKGLRLQKCITDQSKILAYKARPLNGIWATAPYLHDGSVPSLYDLLLPPEQRPGSFRIGSREFDPEKVGFQTMPTADNDQVFHAVDATGGPIDGSSNEGHDYGSADLTSSERSALVEYLKTL